MENQTILIETNDTQTPITEELLSQYPDEVREQFLDFIYTVPFISNLISPKRPEVYDLPRDEKGRAIIDITNPPIIRNVDYFRKTVLDYINNEEEYTKLRPNSNPNSEYRKFWEEEKRRIWNGYLRESDGLWIPGYLYWELNYIPMLINEVKKGSKKAIRKVGFPAFFDGTFFRFSYLNNAIENGHHAAELAKRGAGKAHPYYSNVYTPNGLKKWKDIKNGDILYTPYGNTTKVIDIPFDDVVDIYEITLRDGRKVRASSGHLWNVIWRNKQKLMTTLDILDNYKQKRKVSDRIPNGVEYIIGIPKNQGVEWDEKETKVDPYTFGLLLGDGCFRHGSCYYTCSDSDFQYIKENIPYKYTKWSGKFAYRLHINNWKEILVNYGLNNLKSEDKFIPDEYKFNSKKVRLELLKGLIDSDGTVGKNKRYSIALSSKRMIEDIAFICRSLGYNCHYTTRDRSYKKDGKVIKCLPSYELLIYTEDILAKLPRKQVIEEFNSKYSSSKYYNTKIIDVKYIGKELAKCVTVDDERHEYLIEDFINTHNSYTLAAIMSRNLIFGKSEDTKKRWTTVLTAYQKEYLKGDKDGTLSKFEPTLSHVFATTPFPHLMLKNSSNEMVWQMGYKNIEGIVDKKSSLNTVMGVSAKDDSDKLRGKRADILYEEFGNFNGLLELYDACRRGTEDGDFAFALMYLVGTANNKESNFQSAKTLLYAPKAYNIEEVDNVYDKKGQGRPKFAYFYPAYLNRMGCMDKDGNSDVVAALLQILMRRYDAKYGADPTSVLRVIAEDPITPAEAIIKVKDAYFPVQALTERSQQLDMNPRLYDDIYVGELEFNSSGEIEFKPNGDTPIRTYPVDNTLKGALEIYQMPVKDSKNKIFDDRYIASCDPYDNDQAESSSLYSIFVFDLFTDNIVAEYTGRTNYANDAHEMVRRLCLFYNAKCLYESNKKGLFAYMEAKHSTYLLANTPEYLRDKQLIKYSNFGSNQKGVNASASINNFANRLIKDWLNKLIPIVYKHDDGSEEVKNAPILYTLKNRALIEELIQFNPEMNFDRIRSLGMLMLYREEYIIKYGNNMNAESRENSRLKTLANDDFFSRNFDSRFI